MSLEPGRSEEFEFDALDAFGDWLLPLTRRVFDSDSEFVTTLERKLAESRMPDTVELYLSRGVAVGLLSGLVLWLLGTVVGYVLFATGLIPVDAVSAPTLGVFSIDEATRAFLLSLKLPFLVFVTGLVFGSLGFTAAFGVFTTIPYTRSSARRREINLLLPDVISFMYALSVGGLNQLEILESVARADDTYGEAAREFQSIVWETAYFDTDYRSAIREQASVTPSEELSQFLVDMLSIINSGGDLTRFFDDKRSKHMRTARNEQEMALDTLELFGEMYMTLSLFPLLLIIILAAMSLLGQVQDAMLYLTVYGLLPLLGVMFLVMLATVRRDDPGSGYLRPEDDSYYVSRERERLSDVGLVERFVGKYRIFDRIHDYEGSHEAVAILTRPHHFFRDHPLYTLVVTVPVALVLVGLSVASGGPASWHDVLATPVESTIFYLYVPIYIVFTPLAVFHEWNVRSRRAVLHNLSDNLRKLSSANDTGLTLLESIKTVAETTPGKLAREFENMYAKVDYGMSLEESLLEFNNRYHLPRLARTLKLIMKAQEASNHISSVLSAAAQASENQDDIEREQKTRTRMQVVIIVMTFLTLLAVMAILKTQFIDVMSRLTANASDATGFGSGVNTPLLSLLFFHAVTLQAIISGIICGYIQEADVRSGLKYVVVMLSVSLVVWMVVG
ncbi:type II secretion system F family protein [Haloferax sp. ATB1]|uniref:type II secretion system F family protein n=1 Tax=Haloferax sp. ATB1 TaxID=1508454 RepID=UPI0005B1F17F|nr:type II secretion system F family protein [Haloferax sp. ATB1]